MTRRGRNALAAAALLIAACGGTQDPTTTAAATTTSPPPPPTTSEEPATSTPVETTTTQAPTSTPPPQTGMSVEFRHASEDTEEFSYTISFPLLVDASGTPLEAANAHLRAWVDGLIAEVEAGGATLDAKATLTAQVAPELINDAVFSVSGVSTRFVDAGAGTVSRRHGWIIDLGTGSIVAATDLLLDGDLSPLAEAARSHLVSDVFGGEDVLAGPDGLLPVPANFDAVWLTSTGIGVGFDEGQVAAPDAGVPAVFIPFAELDPFLVKAGVLAPLNGANELPEL